MRKTTTSNTKAMREPNKLNLTPDIKTRVSQFLLQYQQEDGKPARGKIQEVAQLLGISRRSVHTIWAETKRMLSNGEAVIFKKKEWSSHKDKMKLDLPRLKALPLSKRTTYRRIAREMQVSKSLVGNWVKEGLIRPHTNAIRPILTDQNKLQRLKLCLSSLHNFDSALNKFTFKSMHNTVHIDEKWFYITTGSMRCYLGASENDPYRACKNKRYISKLMFMSAVARPQYANNGELLFDGKLGIFPFTKQEAAKRKSKNRDKGVLETKPLGSINKAVIKDCLINQIIPAIKEKWPGNYSRDIYIQQDNARPHIKDDDIEFRAAASSDGFNIHLVCQPANSPDTNINDLGFFRAIQSLAVETAAKNVDELVQNIKTAYNELTHTCLNNVFLSLQRGMIEIMKCKGHNNFKQPHMGKQALMRNHDLPESLDVDFDLIKECIEFIKLPGNDIPSEYDVEGVVNSIGGGLLQN